MTRSSGRNMDAAIGELASAMEAELDPLVADILCTIRAELDTLDERQWLQLEAPMRSSTYGLTRGSLAAMCRRRHSPVEVPVEAIEEARAAARAGLPLSDLLTMYRIGHQVCLDRCMELANRTSVDTQLRLEMLRITSRFTFGYIDAVVREVANAFEIERDQYVRSSAQRTMQMVRDILNGAYLDATELGYDLLGRHIAVVADGPDAESALRRWTSSLKARSLVVGVDSARAWGWLAMPEVGSLSADLYLNSVRFGLGDTLTGPDGFRGSHRQAVLACAVATRLGVEVCRYDDVALEAAVLADESAGRRFVQRELGALAESGERNERLRSTMSAYLSAGHNAANAGAALNITDRTVAYRLNTCEELLGRSMLDRSTELAIALRWGRVLGVFG